MVARTLWRGLYDLTPYALARLRMAASNMPRVIRMIKVFSFCNILHFTSHFHFARFNGVKYKVYLQFTFLLPQTAVANYITQVCGRG